jgi:hypothetical protein
MRHLEVPIVHPRLVICLSLSIVVGILAAGFALSAGWSLLWALPIYSGVGATTLVATTVLAALVEDVGGQFLAKPQRGRIEQAHA